MQHRTHPWSSKLGLHGAAVISEHGVVTFEAPNAVPALITRFARNAMPGVLALNSPAPTAQVRQLAEYASAFCRE